MSTEFRKMRGETKWAILLAVLLSVILLFSLVMAPNVNVAADSVKMPEEKVYSTATLEDDFSDDGILIVLNQDASLNFKNYSINDFLSGNGLQVQDLTPFSGEMVKQEMSLADSKELNMLNKSKDLGAIDNDEVSKIKVEDFRRILRIELKEKSKENVLAAIKQLEKNKDILYAGPDYTVTVMATSPNDKYYKSGDQWPVNDLNLLNAWDISTGSSAVTVGILDSGVDATHPDLINRVNRTLSRDFTSSTTTTPNPPTDPHGHGTHVAGILGAQGNNGIGIVGTCWNVNIVSLRIMDASGFGKSSGVARAIDYATSQGIDILNFSGGWTANHRDFDMALNSSIQNFPGLFVCAAGNDGQNNDNVSSSKAIYPANYQLHNMITVGALGRNGQIEKKSNYGATTVDVFAPGEDVMSTYPNSICTSFLHILTPKGEGHVENGFHEKSGTSMAAPYVAGVAALILARYPGMEGSALKAAILDNVEKVGVLQGKCVSHGRVDAYRALKNAALSTISGDFNGDGKTDIAKFIDSGNNKAGIHVWRSTGSSFAYQGEVWTPTSYRIGAIAYRAEAGDFNGDGKDDIAVFYDYKNRDTRIHVWLSTGSSFNYQGDMGWWRSTLYDAYMLTGRVVCGDFNGDGKDDLAAFYDYRNDIMKCHVWLSSGYSFAFSSNSGNNGWCSQASYTAGKIANRVVCGDFNGDGKDDIAALYDYTNRASRMHVWLSTGSQFIYQGNEGWWQPGLYAAPNVSTRMICDDFNGDGKDDIAAIYNYSATTAITIRIHVLLSTGTSFAYQGDAGWYVHSSYFANAINGRVVSGKFNGDGRFDIAALYDYGANHVTIHTWLSTGSQFTYQGNAGWWSSNIAI